MIYIFFIVVFQMLSQFPGPSIQPMKLARQLNCFTNQATQTQPVRHLGPKWFNFLKYGEHEETCSILILLLKQKRCCCLFVFFFFLTQQADLCQQRCSLREDLGFCVTSFLQVTYHPSNNILVYFSSCGEFLW